MSMDAEKLDRTVVRYLEGTASDEESAWLAARLGESSSDLDIMVETLLVEAELIHLADEGDLCAVELQSPRWWRKPGVVSLTAAAAVIALTALVLSWIAAPPADAFARWTPSPGGVVSVAGSEGEAGQELAIGSTLRVSQGCAEVTLAEGVRCLVQAPASLRLEAEGRVHLEDGVGWFRVEEQARGFEVTTEELRVVDLGTEFGVDTRGDGRAEVHVMSGTVEVQALAALREVSRLEAGAAVALGAAGKLESTLFRPELFVSRLPSGIPALHFDFDESRDGVFEAEGSIARREDVRIRIGARESARVGKGHQGGALHFHGNRYAVSNWPGIGGTSPRTVAFWIRLSQARKAAPIIGWGRFDDPTKMAEFGIRTVGKSGQLRLVSGRRWLESERSIADGKWHHVLVMLGSHRKGSWPEVQLFIDGEEDVLMPGEPWKHLKAPLDTFWTDIHHAWSQPVTLGRFVAEGPQYFAGLDGALDELIIAEGVLTGDQVRALYEGRLEESGLALGE